MGRGPRSNSGGGRQRDVDRLCFPGACSSCPSQHTTKTSLAIADPLCRRGESMSGVPIFRLSCFLRSIRFQILPTGRMSWVSRWEPRRNRGRQYITGRRHRGPETRHALGRSVWFERGKVIAQRWVRLAPNAPYLQSPNWNLLFRFRSTPFHVLRLDGYLGGTGYRDCLELVLPATEGTSSAFMNSMTRTRC